MHVLFDTPSGKITIDVFETKAPRTAAYFLDLIDRGHYDETHFYRSTKLGDFPQLDFGGRSEPDDQGFPAFGEVHSGLDIVFEIAEAETSGETRIKMLAGEILTSPVAITNARRESLHR